MTKEVTIRELLKMEIDIDVCDDYDESCYIAFCGALHLTPAGEKEFEDILDDKVTMGDEFVTLHADTDDKVTRYRKLFFSAAGYCRESEYFRLFEE